MCPTTTVRFSTAEHEPGTDVQCLYRSCFFCRFKGGRGKSGGSSPFSPYGAAESPAPFSHRLAVKDLSVPRPLLRRRDFFQQFAGALADQGGFVIRDAIAAQQRALDFLIDADQIANFFSYIVHVEPPSVVQISMNATSGQIITELLPSRAQEGSNQQ